MRIFDYKRLKNIKWDTETVNLIAQIYQSKGKCERYTLTNRDELNRLIEIAKVQSTEGSNAIEGIRTTNTRLKQLVENKTTPKNCDEEEIAGYRDVLSRIHESYEYISITPNYILQLHQIMYAQTKRSAIGGKFKNVQNYISATDGNGNSVTLFTPLAPFETPSAIEEICKSYNEMIEYGEIDPLILIPVFIHDFLCIHPFLDGNGRISRLLTTLLLYKSGIDIGKYISLEAKIASNKDLYYDALASSQVGWHDGKENVEPFIRYLLGIILSAYKDFEGRVDIISQKKPATELVRDAVKRQLGKFKKADIIPLVPNLSASSIEKALKELTDSEQIVKHGNGKGTFYTRK